MCEQTGFSLVAISVAVGSGSVLQERNEPKAFMVHLHATVCVGIKVRMHGRLAPHAKYGADRVIDHPCFTFLLRSISPSQGPH